MRPRATAWPLRGSSAACGRGQRSAARTNHSRAQGSAPQSWSPRALPSRHHSIGFLQEAHLARGSSANRGRGASLPTAAPRNGLSTTPGQFLSARLSVACRCQETPYALLESSILRSWLETRGGTMLIKLRRFASRRPRHRVSGYPAALLTGFALLVVAGDCDSPTDHRHTLRDGHRRRRVGSCRRDRQGHEPPAHQGRRSPRHERPRYLPRSEPPAWHLHGRCRAARLPDPEAAGRRASRRGVHRRRHRSSDRWAGRGHHRAR